MLFNDVIICSGQLYMKQMYEYFLPSTNGPLECNSVADLDQLSSSDKFGCRYQLELDENSLELICYTR